MSFPRLDSLDHQRVGTLYLAAVLVVFVLGGVLALYLHSELWTAGETLLSAAEFDRVITAHGLLMVFLVLVPAIPGVLGHLVLPRRLGLATLAVPELAVLSLTFYMLGALAALLAALFGGLDGGWDFFAAVRPGTDAGVAQSVLTFGVTLVAASQAAAGLNFILTVRRARLAADDAPVFAWTLCAAAVLQLVAFAVLVVTLSLLSRDARFGGGLIDPAAGGDALLPRRWFWMFAQPWVASAMLPAVGLIAETLARSARKPVFAPRTLTAAVAALGVLAALAWGRHLFGSGAAVDAAVYSGFALLAAVPSVLIAVSWLGTLYGGAVRFSTAFWYALGAIALLGAATVGNFVLATPGPGALLRGTLFESAHLHYLVGGVLMAFLAGLHAWWPGIVGRPSVEGLGRLGATLVFLGFNAAFAPRLLMGLRGARLGWSGLPGDLGVLSVIGGWVLSAGVAVLIWGLLASLRRTPSGEPVGD